MRVWLVTAISLFLLVQIYQWLRGFMLPLPLYVMAGAFLAIASNYQKGMESFFSFSQPPLRESATLIEEKEALGGSNSAYLEETTEINPVD